jgi:hypothetical protein
LGINGTKTKASVSLQRLHSKDFNGTKEYLQGESHSQGVVSLEWFEAAIVEAALRGSPTAQAFVRASVGNTLTMYLDDAFGVERATKERITWREVRMAGIMVRNSATDAIRDHFLALGKQAQAHHYIQATEALNRSALGFTAVEYKKAHGLETKTNMRELLSQKQLKSLDFAEELFARLLRRAGDFKVALNQACQTSVQPLECSSPRRLTVE